jgi:arabinose-5-phosphate isomerase
MSTRPSTIAPDALVASAVRQMEEHPGGAITALVVIDAQGKPAGLLHLHDCLRSGAVVDAGS